MSRLMRYLVIFLLIITAKGNKCFKGCRPALNGKVNCQSGGCDEGCLPGFFGKTCEKHCSKNCKSDVCAFDDGTCSGGCTDNYCGDQCTRRCDTDSISETTVVSTMERSRHSVSSLNTSPLTDTSPQEKPESSTEVKSSPDLPEAYTTNSRIIGSSLHSTPSVGDGGKSDYSKILLYACIGVAVLLVNAVFICSLYMCVRRILYRTNSRIEATHASIRVIELACMPQRSVEVNEVEQPTPSTSYLTATQDTTDQERVVSTHVYDVVDSNDLEPVMLLADCFDDFVPNFKTDPLLKNSPEGKGKYLLPI